MYVLNLRNFAHVQSTPRSRHQSLKLQRTSFKLSTAFTRWFFRAVIVQPCPALASSKKVITLNFSGGSEEFDQVEGGGGRR
jgi:hypothetical protein